MANTENNNPNYSWLNFGYDIAGSQINAASSYAYNRDLMSYQNELNKDFNQWNYTSAPSLQRAGLEKAGYNPILALGGSPTYSGGSVGNSSVNVSDSHMGTNAGQLRVAQKAQQADADLKFKQGVNVDQDTANKLIEGGVLNEQIDNIRMDTALKAINLKLSEKDLSWKDKLYYNQIKTNMINAMASQGQASASVTNAKAAMINARSNQDYKNLDVKWQRKHPILNTFSRSGVGSLIKPR